MPRGHIRQRASGTWVCVIPLGRDPLTQKRRQKWLSARTKKEAQQKLNRALAELDAGTYQEPTRLTVSEYLDRWLRDYVEAQLAPTSQQTYRAVLRLHALPVLGPIRLDQLRPLHLQAVYTSLQQPAYRGGHPLSGTSALMVHSILHRALTHAVRWQLIPRNPADALEPPRRDTKERPVLNLEEMARLLHAVDGTWLHVPVLLAITTGMRRGEVLGLRWQDVSAKAGEIRVNQAVIRALGETRFGPPKSKSGKRIISVPDLLLDAFARRRAEQAELIRSLGAAYRDHGLIICRPDGAPFHPDSLSDAFGRIRGSLGLGVTFHDLRHSHATLLLLLDVHARIVQERLGHGTLAQTMDTYSHVLPSMQRETAELIDRTLRAVLEAPARPGALAIGAR